MIYPTCCPCWRRAEKPSGHWGESDEFFFEGDGCFNVWQVNCRTKGRCVCFPSFCLCFKSLGVIFQLFLDVLGPLTNPTSDTGFWEKKPRGFTKTSPRPTSRRTTATRTSGRWCGKRQRRRRCQKKRVLS